MYVDPDFITFGRRRSMVVRINTRDGAVGINSNSYDEGYLTIRKQNSFTPQWQYPLMVNGLVWRYRFIIRYGVSDNGWKDVLTVWRNFIIKADGDMMLYHGAYYCTSDSRVKKDIQEIQPNSAINEIAKMNIVKFHYLDSLSASLYEQRGVVAQELQKILPSAITGTPMFIPSVYTFVKRLYTKGKYTRIPLANHQLKKDDVVKIFVSVLKDSSQIPLEVPVIAVCKGSVTVPNLDSVLLEMHKEYPKNYKIDIDKPIFVYGKLVTDGLGVDYNQIMITNVAATQALIHENVQLKNENTQLKNEYQAQEASIQQLEETVEKLISSQKKKEQIKGYIF